MDEFENEATSVTGHGDVSVVEPSPRQWSPPVMTQLALGERKGWNDQAAQVEC